MTRQLRYNGGVHSIIETGRPIVIIVETEGQGRAKVVGWLRSIPRESGGVAGELLVQGSAQPLPQDQTMGMP